MQMRKMTRAELEAETAAIARWFDHLARHPHRPYEGRILGR